MAAKVKHAKDAIPKLAAALIEQQRALARQLGERVGQEAIKTLQPTLDFNEQSGSGALSDAKIVFKLTTKKVAGRGIKLTVIITVVGKNGRPHKIWGWLNFGTAGFIQPNTSPPIDEVFGNRTFPGDFQAHEFTGFTGSQFFIRAGTPVSGIDARGWYEKSADRLVALVKQYPGWYVLSAEARKHP